MKYAFNGPGSIRRALGELIAAGIIIGTAFWFPWLFYAFTGQPLQF